MAVEEGGGEAETVGKDVGVCVGGGGEEGGGYVVGEGGGVGGEAGAGWGVSGVWKREEDGRSCVRVCLDSVEERGVVLADDAADAEAVGSKVLQYH